MITVTCCATVNKNSMKISVLCDKMHAKFFSNSSRVGHAGQLLKGESPFQHLFDRVPVESHVSNTSIALLYKHRVKYALIGKDTNPWHI